MPEYFRNDRPYPIDIPRWDIRAAPGALFTVPDEDAGSLYDDPGYTALDANGNPLGTGALLLTEAGDTLTAETGDQLTTI